MAKNPGVKLLAEIKSRFPEIKSVKDAKKSKKITFAIDTRDCEMGIVESKCHCPTALAVARHTGKYALVRGWVTVLIDADAGTAERLMNDAPLARAIRAFDASGQKGHRAQFQPGIYTMRAPGPRQSLNRRPPGPTKRRGSHPHKGPQSPLRQSWGEPNPRLAPVFSKFV